VRPLPARDADIAFGPVTQLSRWIETRQLSSERLTQIYLKRLERFDSKLRCVITPTRDLALEKAKRADAEIAAGKFKGPLHGIPWGAKDLLDTAGIATTYGAEPFRNRVPAADATVVPRKYLASGGPMEFERIHRPPRRREMSPGAGIRWRGGDHPQDYVEYSRGNILTPTLGARPAAQ
jgi:hypothetical protein